MGEIRLGRVNVQKRFVDSQACNAPDMNGNWKRVHRQKTETNNSMQLITETRHMI